MRENVTHLIARYISLNSGEQYSGLLDYISKNKSLKAIHFVGRSNFHEKKWLELHECLSQNKSIETVRFDNVTLNALINHPNAKVKKTLSRELLDTLSKQYADRAQVTVSPLILEVKTPAITIPEATTSPVIRKRTRALQVQLPRSDPGLIIRASSSEHFQLPWQTQVFLREYALRVSGQPLQASSIRHEARTAVTNVNDETADESYAGMCAAQSSQLETASSMDEAAVSDDEDGAIERLLSLRSDSREHFTRADKRPRH